MSGKGRALVLDVSKMGYEERLAAASIQGIANRSGPLVYLHYGYYDDPASRRTNEPFIPDDIWESTFRAAIGDQDEINVEYYRESCGLRFEEAASLDELAGEFRHLLAGSVVYDPGMPDAVNVAIAYGALEDLVPVSPGLAPWAAGLGLEARRDLRGWPRDRTELYERAYRELFPRCAPGKIACVEPGWQRPEFVDYLVRERIFPYSLAHRGAGRRGALGKALALFLVGGPATLRNLAFDLRWDGAIRRAALGLMEASNPEFALAGKLQRAAVRAWFEGPGAVKEGEARDTADRATAAIRAVKEGEALLDAFPTIYGWHTKRDDEFDFMVALSANGLRLVPAHLAANYSFHAGVPAARPFAQDHAEPSPAALEKKVYLCFTLSDGDQLVAMHTGSFGNWRLPERGSVAFNWEVQPLLAEMAPALLGRYFLTKSPADYLIAGPSGAGYVIPPLCPDLRRYLEASAACERAGIRAGTSYIGDPPRRVLRELARSPRSFVGWLMGYANLGRAPAYVMEGRALAANALPELAHIWDDAPSTLEAVRRAIDETGTLPAFIGAHLFAYKTTISDVSAFVATLDPGRVKVVRADEFLMAAEKGSARWTKK